MCKYLVTGGAGFIGSNLVDKLIQDGHEVYVWDNLSTGHLCNVNPSAHFVLKDIQSIDTTIVDYNFDAIFHLAAVSRIQPSFDNPENTFQSNITATFKILELAKKNNSKVIFAGTCCSYYDQYANPYAFSKSVGEQLCKLYNKTYNLPVAITRFFNVYGPRQIETGPYSTLIGIFKKQKENGEKLTITGTGKKKRDFIHVDDIVSGLIAMSKDSWNAEIFNLGTGVSYSVNDIAKIFKCPTIYIPERQGEAHRAVADISFTKEKLKWEPKVNIKEYIESL